MKDRKTQARSNAPKSVLWSGPCAATRSTISWPPSCKAIVVVKWRGQGLVPLVVVELWIYRPVVTMAMCGNMYS